MKLATSSIFATAVYQTGGSRWSEYYAVDDLRAFAKDFALHLAGKTTRFRPDMVELTLTLNVNTVPTKTATISGFHKLPICNDQTLVFKLGKVLGGSRRYQFERDELLPMFNRTVEFLS